MLFKLPSDDDLYDALVARDPCYEGRAWVCVSSTGIFCRLTCPARNPKRENCQFYDSIAACIAQGFRPCLRCRPMDPPGQADPIVARLLRALETDPHKRWTEADVTALGVDPSTARRAFRKRFGISFLEIARARRVGIAARRVASGAPVIEAQLDSGYDSGSGFRDAVIRHVGAAPARLKGCVSLQADWVETPLGPMLAVVDDRAVRLLEFADRPGLPAELDRLKKAAAISFGPSPVIDRLGGQLERYFHGKLAQVEVPLAQAGTPFQRVVWQELQNIPPGETRSYSALARALDRPEATRAVARANGANTIAILIPCHRIIGADGTLTGYGGGLWRKQWLLAQEARYYFPAL